jgi:hypothetical protein
MHKFSADPEDMIESIEVEATARTLATKEYADTAPRCVKCGAADIHTRWEPSILECGWSGRTGREGREAEFSGEHLHRLCCGCGFEWGDKPLDYFALAPEAERHHHIPVVRGEAVAPPFDRERIECQSCGAALAPEAER